MVAAYIKRAEMSDEINGLESIRLVASIRTLKLASYTPKFENMALFPARLLS